MKIIILFLALTSLNSFGRSRDYTCDVRLYRLDLTLGDSSTSLWVWDKFAREYIYNGFASSREVLGSFVTYYFYPTTGAQSKLTFDQEDINELPDRLFGFIDGNFGVLIYDDF